MKYFLLCWLAFAMPLRASLPATPLESVYHALLDTRPSDAWEQLLASEARLSGRAQRIAWRQALEQLVAGQCGKDIPLTLPPGVEALTLKLVQRDLPLSRIYRVELNGRLTRPEIRFSLTMPDGVELLSGQPRETEPDGGFRIESQERAVGLLSGVWRLTIKEGNKVYVLPLALQGAAELNWLTRVDGQIQVKPPAVPGHCPSPWFEQALLNRADFQIIDWRRDDTFHWQRWQVKDSQQRYWSSLSVISAETRGGLVLEHEQRLAGPLAQF